MAAVWGALGQVNPLATTLTTAYTAPAAKHAAVQVVIANVGAVATVRIAHSPAGAAIDPKHYILYDYSLAAGASQSTARFAVKATDVIRVYASTANVAFNVNGIEDDD